MDSIVPDVIDRIPKKKLTVRYPKNLEVNFGNELKPGDVREEPLVHWRPENGKIYLLVMLDPDALSRDKPIFREVNHWLVGNIKGSDVKSGDVITEYLGSAPPKGTGLHRYVFLLYEQPNGRMVFKHPKTSKNSRAHRLKFCVRKFGKQHCLGDPIAYNYFLAQWDPYVDEQNKLMKNDFGTCVTYVKELYCSVM